MIRFLLHRVVRDGRLLLISKRKIHTKTVENCRNRKKRNATEKTDVQVLNTKRGPLWNAGSQARRLFVDNFSGKATSVNNEVVFENARRLFYNNRIPFFAFVGVSLASGSVGIITKDDELERYCWDIRDTVTKMQSSREFSDHRLENVSLEDLEIGPNIGKGCSAVVYSAALKSDTDILMPVTVAEPGDNESPLERFPFALKMMFNYDIQSNALMILQAMYRETIPARSCSVDTLSLSLVPSGDTLNQLPPHANIVTMFNAFCAQVPDIKNAESLYPMALPSRLYADGYGRNMSLFLLMKRYNYTLDKFLTTNEMKANPRHALIIFAQLLEAVAHLFRHGVSHRDLKADNVLVEHNRECTVPLLAITDFGCSLMDRVNKFRVPYPTANVDKGGNVALMAPEIITQQPSSFAVLNYTKADLWAAGTIAYEIFGQTNPFVGTKERESLLRNFSYNDGDLPDLPESVPWLMRSLIANILQRNPKKRLYPDVAANVMQLFLWAPTAWLQPSERLPTSDEIVEWLFCLTTKVLCENMFNSGVELINNKESYTEYLLISSFLQRANLNKIKQALKWIQSIVGSQRP